VNCDEVHELLPAYVLGALDADEVDALEAHLRAGKEHDEELLDLRATVFALDRYVHEPAPSPALGARISRIALDHGRAAGRWAPFQRLFARPALVAGVAVLLLVVFGAGWLGADVFRDNEAQVLSVTLQGENGQIVTLNGRSDEAVVSVVMTGLERLPSEKSYQLWALRGGQWLPIGTCNTNPEGRWKGQFPYALRADEGVVLTVEPAGGSARPTSEPILRSLSF
jgi:anti-sigma-K factor RskA